VKWKWYEYINPSATELVLAVRAINVFFSLSLVLIGIANIIFAFAIRNNSSLAVMLALSSLLWGVRCIMQIIYPQGTVNSMLQYGMLTVFVLVFLSFSTALLLLMLN
jgi:hypothetical protein